MGPAADCDGPPWPASGTPGVCGPEGVRGGGFLRSRWKAFILAAMSGFNVPLLPMVVGGGLRAALRGPRGVEEAVMPPVVAEFGGRFRGFWRADGWKLDCCMSRPGEEVSERGGEGEVGDSSGLSVSLGESMLEDKEFGKVASDSSAGCCPLAAAAMLAW